MRLLSYNIHKGVGGSDRRYRLGRVLDVIRAEEPDLVCLQEVDFNVKRSNFDNQPAILADALHVQTALFQLNVPHRQGGYGNLILSRWPLHQEHHVSLRLHRRKPRGAQLVVVDTPHGSLHLINWHLGLAEKERRWQVGHLLAHHHFAAQAHLPTLIAGDFNDWRNTLGKHRLSAHDFEQVTAPVREFRTFPAFLPLASLDKVYRRGPLRIDEAALVRHRLSRRASDHLPLRIDFCLESATPPL
jgi:endonuclease/exonuclease/phosphatase family metal-dependent hydrolase